MFVVETFYDAIVVMAVAISFVVMSRQYEVHRGRTDAAAVVLELARMKQEFRPRPSCHYLPNALLT